MTRWPLPRRNPCRLSRDNVVHATITASADLPANAVGQQTTEFTLLRIAGEGGMGIVYRALQHYPKRIVALKIFKSSVASPTAAKRFRREIAVLARLHHPGIAQLYSVGATAPALAGQSAFIAMEFIDGLPLTTFADHRGLDIHARVRLFLKVCDALTYLHQQFIIHRDLKPTNILVDAQGNPRLIDFGLAWIIDNDNPASLLTQTGELVGTLEYMAPEQAAADHQPIDAQTDIYSLGIILYELLAARRPFNLAAHSLIDAALAIAHAIPEKLSTRNPKLAGDLETVVHTAIQKDKSQRYKTIAALAEDLRRYLADLPILAATPSVPYRARKFFRRNRWPLLAAACVFVALLLGWIATLLQQQRFNTEAIRTNAANRQADARLADADLAQGDALAVANNFDAARDSYNRARDNLANLGLPTLAATLALWQLNLAAAQPLRILEPRADSLSALALSPDQKLLALGFADGHFEVRDFPTNTTLFSLVGPAPLNDYSHRTSSDKPALIQSLLFSPKASTLAVFSDSRWHFVDVAAKSPKPNSPNAPTSSTALFLDERALLTLFPDGNPTILSLSDGGDSFFHDSDFRPLVALAPTPDGVIVVDDLNNMARWSNKNHAFSIFVKIPLDAQSGLAFSPDASLLAIPSPAAVTFLSTTTLHQTARLRLNPTERFLAFASPATLLLADHQHSVVRAVDLSGHLVGTVPTQSPDLLVARGDLILHLDPRKQLTASLFRQPQEVRLLTQSDEPLTAIALSPDASRAALATPHSIRILDTAQTTLIQTLPLPAPIAGFHFNDDNILLLTPSNSDLFPNLLAENNTLTFLDPADHHILRAIPFPFRLAAPTPDARHALLLTQDNTALLLDFTVPTQIPKSQLQSLP